MLPNPYDLHTEMFKLLTHEGDGALSTISIDVEGYPFGSVTPYCLDSEFRPNILISTIAQHTRNIMANPKVSLLISENDEKTNKQAKARLTYIGDAEKVEDDTAIKQRYLSYFPAAKDYFATHGFSFYRIRPQRLRFIGGFGKIYWIEKDSLTLTNLFTADEENKIVSHMNEDHGGNLRDYARYYMKHEFKDGDLIRMCGLDQFGVDLAVNESKQRIEFPNVITEASEARGVFVTMARDAKS